MGQLICSFFSCPWLDFQENHLEGKLKDVWYSSDVEAEGALRLCVGLMQRKLLALSLQTVGRSRGHRTVETILKKTTHTVHAMRDNEACPVASPIIEYGRRASFGVWLEDSLRTVGVSSISLYPQHQGLHKMFNIC